jgi:alkylation response protein AidB-like acyl-CoA dehydrogenase
LTTEYAIPLTEEEDAFRQEVCAFIDEKLKPEWRGVSELWSRTDMQALAAWTRELVAKGWATPDWPEEYGGRPLTVMQRYIIARETARVRAPLIPHVNLHMVGPLITRYGNDWQKQHLLPRLLNADDYWSQGFSEPGSGSDLASLRTTARREGDKYIVNGQKIWTTAAHLGTELLCLVRTDPDAARPQAGISMLLVPLNSPGLTVRPIRSIDEIHHLNEVFFDNVEVPAERLLGEENKGWAYAKEMLSWERGAIADVQPTRVIMSDVLEVARESGAMADPLFRQRVLETEFDIDALEVMELRVLQAETEEAQGGYEPSLLKILGSTLRQAVLQLGRESLGALAEIMPSPDAPVPASGRGRTFLTDALLYRAATIYGGSNEIQKNLVARIAFSGQGGVGMRPMWLTDEQRQLGDMLKSLAAEGTVPASRLAELGVMAATLPEAYGGLGLGLTDATVIAEALGRIRNPAPFNETAVITGGLIERLGSEAQRAAWLPRIADGSLSVALAFAEGFHFDPLDPRCTSKRVEDGYVLEGRKEPVVGAPDAELVIISTRSEDGIALHAVPTTSLRLSVPYRTVDGLKAATIDLNGVRLTADTLLGDAQSAGEALEDVLHRAMVVQAAEQTGLMAHLIDATVVYLQQRRQFGVPLASFQVLQHRVADMLLAYEKAVSLVVKARFKDGEPLTDARRRASLGAALLAMRGARFVGHEAIQLHGGMGVTEELSVGPTVKRIYGLETRLGPLEAMAARYAAQTYGG